MKSRLVVILLGLFTMLILLSYGWSVYSPNEAEAQMNQENADKATTEGNKMPEAKKRVAKAMVAVNNEAATWRGIEAQHTPPASFSQGGVDVSENGWQLVTDLPRYRDSVQREVNAQVKSGGVKVIQGPLVTNPPQSGATVLADYFNYPAIPFPVLLLPLGQIVVQGTSVAQIEANVRSWAHMPRYLAVADGLRIDGTSPNLTGTYSAAMVGYIRGNKLYVAVPEGAAASGGGGFNSPPAGGAGRPPGVPGGGPPSGPQGGPPAGLPGVPSGAMTGRGPGGK